MAMALRQHFRSHTHTQKHTQSHSLKANTPLDHKATKKHAIHWIFHLLTVILWLWLNKMINCFIIIKHPPKYPYENDQNSPFYLCSADTRELVLCEPLECTRHVIFHFNDSSSKSKESKDIFRMISFPALGWLVRSFFSLPLSLSLHLLLRIYRFTFFMWS